MPRRERTFGPAAPATGVLRSVPEVIDVEDELVVIGFLRRDAARFGAAAMLDQATTHALRCLSGGASIGEACAEGHKLLESCSRHPSRNRDAAAAAGAGIVTRDRCS